MLSTIAGIRPFAATYRCQWKRRRDRKELGRRRHTVYFEKPIFFLFVLGNFYIVDSVVQTEFFEGYVDLLAVRCAGGVEVNVSLGCRHDLLVSLLQMTDEAVDAGRE